MNTRPYTGPDGDEHLECPTRVAGHSGADTRDVGDDPGSTTKARARNRDPRSPSSDHRANDADGLQR